MHIRIHVQHSIIGSIAFLFRVSTADICNYLAENNLILFSIGLAFPAN
jgi:hypothetical protein